MKKIILLSLLFMTLSHNQIKALPTACDAGFWIGLASAPTLISFICAAGMRIHTDLVIQNKNNYLLANQDAPLLPELMRKKRITTALAVLTGFGTIGFFATGVGLMFNC